MNKPLHPGLHRQSLEVHSSGSVASLRIPHLLAVGAKPGPTTAIVAGAHGRELAGVMSAAQSFSEIDPANLAGTVHFLPALNPLAIQMRRQDFPLEDSRYRKMSIQGTSNIDRLWDETEGDSHDPLLRAITGQVWGGVLQHCDQLLDLHCWSQFFCPMAWAHERDERLLRQTGFPYLTLRKDSPVKVGTLRERAWESKKPIVVAELPGQNVVSEFALKLGTRTIRNFLIAVGHLNEAADLPESQIVTREDLREVAIDLPVGGLWRPFFPAGQMVEQGAILGEVIDLQSFEAIWTARAEIAGLVLFNGPPIWGEDHREHQVVFAGQRVIRLREVL